MDLSNRDALAELFAQICSDAAVEVMAVYETDFEVRMKDDYSPVSDADERAEAVILAALERHLPGIPVIAEEAFSAGSRVHPGARFLLVDPVDGTREFVNRNGEFTVNIGLIVDGCPVAGAVYAPALGRIYAGGKVAWMASLRPGENVATARRVPLEGRSPATGDLIAVASRSHADDETQAFLKASKVVETISAGSSLKFCLLAEGRADVYPRFGPTCEWDIAAGHSVLAAAGGEVVKPDGSPFVYGKVEQGFLNGAFIARSQAPS